jgi:hypothetical protein
MTANTPNPALSNSRNASKRGRPSAPADLIAASGARSSSTAPRRTTCGPEAGPRLEIEPDVHADSGKARKAARRSIRAARGRAGHHPARARSLRARALGTDRARSAVSVRSSCATDGSPSSSLPRLPLVQSEPSLKYDGSRTRRARSRPPARDDKVRQLLLMARENPSWGYTRLRGALENLGLGLRALHHPAHPQATRDRAGPAPG